ncbi:hypothetical protein TNCV_1329611 [Trichonephila clavipes]|nr:hypothetical protein TNCV_1329611 [Trichonephila clavipes]
MLKRRPVGVVWKLRERGSSKEGRSRDYGHGLVDGVDCQPSSLRFKIMRSSPIDLELLNVTLIKYQISNPSLEGRGLVMDSWMAGLPAQVPSS